MMDFKYHITTLTAIFLALAVGILFGMSVSKQLAAQGLAGHAMQKLSAEFKRVMDEDQKVRAENTALIQSLEVRDRFERDLLPAIVAGRLKGKRIALILTGSHEDAKFTRNLAQAIEAAGGMVANTTRIEDKLLPVDPEDRREFLTRFGVQPDTKKPASLELSRALAHAIALGEAPQGLHRASELSEGLSLDGDYSAPVQGALLINCARSDRTAVVESGNSIDSGIITGFKESGVRLVACETEGPYSALPYLRQSGLTTVDSIDKAPGVISLIFALQGAEGSFGLKPGASRLITPAEVTAR